MLAKGGGGGYHRVSLLPTSGTFPKYATLHFLIDMLKTARYRFV